ncbi:MAG: hypothetical protein N3G20_06610 [Verrucomicrobiae bacterium]|nr:hypothetical protein [Verrucomicrobiae bacterium]
MKRGADARLQANRPLDTGNVIPRPGRLCEFAGRSIPLTDSKVLRVSEAYRVAGGNRSDAGEVRRVHGYGPTVEVGAVHGRDGARFELGKKATFGSGLSPRPEVLMGRQCVVLRPAQYHRTKAFKLKLIDKAEPRDF